MLARLKGESKEVIEYISREQNGSCKVIQYLANAGYSKEIIEEVIEVIDLRKLNIYYELNLLAQKEPAAMLARLKGESKEVIEYIENETKVLEYVDW